MKRLGPFFSYYGSKYKGLVHREFSKWFNELAKRGYVIGILGRRCTISSAFCIVWYATEEGEAYLKMESSNNSEADHEQDIQN